MYTKLNENLQQQIDKVQKKITPILADCDRRSEELQWKVLSFFRHHRVTESHLNASTGYGYDDAGRDVLEQIFAGCMGTEFALVRPSIVSGTHAIAIALQAILRSGDHFLYITGKPYDTLHPVIGYPDSEIVPGSLKDLGVSSDFINLTPQGNIDLDAVEKAISPNTRMICIQRSSGYANRPSIPVAEIKRAVSFIKINHPQIIIFTDNCYGEFVETEEPGAIGVDLIAGSLIKNPGGGLAKTGGYLAGKQRLLPFIENRLTAPGIGSHGGATHGHLRDYFQGLFLAPHVVNEAVKGAVFSAALLDECNFKTSPHWSEPRTDIIQKINLEDRELLLQFCSKIQAYSPIDSHVTPTPDKMPGYQDTIIMAAGTFVQGSTIELSADAPLRPPYTLFLQGGLTYAHTKLAVCHIVNQLLYTNSGVKCLLK